MSIFTTYTLAEKVRLVTNGNLISSPLYMDVEIPDELIDLSGG